MRHAIQAGLFRDDSGVEGAPAAAAASGCLSLLSDAVRQGGSDSPEDYVAMIDPVSSHQQHLVLATIDGDLARVERHMTRCRGQRMLRRNPPLPGQRRVAFLHLFVLEGIDGNAGAATWR